MNGVERAPAGESRADWQRTEGRDVYEEWIGEVLPELQTRVDGLLSGAIESFPVSAEELNQTLDSWVSSMYGGIYGPARVLPPSAAVLGGHQEAIMTHTAASNFGEDRDSVMIHAGDSLIFGLSTPLALAIDTFGSKGNVKNDPTRLDDIADVLGDPTFAHCLNLLAGAGLNIYKSGFNTMSSGGLLERMRRVGLEQELKTGEITALIYRDSESGDFVVHKKVIAFLEGTMKEQNTRGLGHIPLKVVGSLQGAKLPATAGCPLRNPSRARHEINQGQSGIAQTAKWLAGAVRQIATFQRYM